MNFGGIPPWPWFHHHMKVLHLLLTSSSTRVHQGPFSPMDADSKVITDTTYWLRGELETYQKISYLHIIFKKPRHQHGNKSHDVIISYLYIYIYIFIYIIYIYIKYHIAKSLRPLGSPYGTPLLVSCSEKPGAWTCNAGWFVVCTGNSIQLDTGGWNRETMAMAVPKKWMV